MKNINSKYAVGNVRRGQGASLGTLGPLFTGLSVLGGGTASTAGTMAIGLSSGFIGSIASQAAANALGLQNTIDIKSALITGLATAATAGINQSIGPINQALKPINTTFNIASAAEMMEQNAASQGMNLALSKHQHFAWEELAVSGITGGILGGAPGKALDEGFNQLVQKTKILGSEVKSLISEGLRAAITGSPFDATKALSDNLGNPLGHELVDKFHLDNLTNSKPPREQIADLSLADDLKEMEETKRAFNNYIAAQLDGREGYGDLLVTEYNPSSTTEYSSAFPIKENLCPISENNEPMLYGSDFPEKSIGTAIYGNSVRFSEGQGALDPILNFSKYGESGNGKYDIDYDALIVKKPGKAYRNDQIVSKSYYNQTPGSPIWGDASKETQIEAIDALITSSIKHGLNAHDTAHVLAIAHTESGFNPYAAAGTTSATGLGQFVRNTGEDYNINNINRWDIPIQAKALVQHFIDNKNRANTQNLSEPYIYKFHHDGPKGNSGGLEIANRYVMPKIREINHVIYKIF